MGLFRFITNTLWTGGALGLPAAAAWIAFSPPPEQRMPQGEIPHAGIRNVPIMMQIPVQIVSTDGSTRQIHIELSSIPIPEPGVLPLAMIGALLVLRRRR